MSKRTKEELEALKQSWINDPIWDIEDTEGFGEHILELKAFRKEQEEKWETIRQEKVRLSFDHRAGQILDELDATDARVGRNKSRYSDIDIESLVIAIQHARAVILLSEQVNRIAEAMQDMNERGSFDERVRIWGGK